MTDYHVIDYSHWVTKGDDGPSYSSVLIDYFHNPKMGPLITEEEVEGLSKGTHKIVKLSENEGGNMSQYASGGYAEGQAFPTVRVDDLLAVFPEIGCGCKTPAEFAEKVRLAADLARKEDALVGLRERIEDKGWGRDFDDGWECVYREASGNEQKDENEKEGTNE